jgi:hypothetical protein
MLLLRSVAAFCRSSRPPGMSTRLPGFVLLVLVASLVLGGSAAGTICPDNVHCPEDDPSCTCEGGGIDPPVSALDISLSPLVVTSAHPSTTASQNDWGAAVRTSIDAWDPESYQWSFALTGTQHIQKLAAGGIAVVSTPTVESDVDPSTDDYADAEAVDPEDVEDGTLTEDPDAADNDAFNDDGTTTPVEPTPEQEEDDPNWEPDPAPAPGSPESDEALAEADRVLGLIEPAQDDAEGDVAAVAGSIVARDAVGTSVPIEVSVLPDRAWVVVAHKDAGYAYPITLTADFVEEKADPGEQPTPTSGDTTTVCPFQARVVTYNPNGFDQLFLALEAHATTCAHYYIVVAPPANPERKREVRRCRSYATQEECRTRSQAIRRDGRPAWIVDYIRQAGANFHPVAEFHWGAWSQVTGWSWQRRGIEFRKRMKAAGYEISRGDTWGLNEFGTTFRYRAATRTNARNAMRGLFYGPRGYARASGIPFLVAIGQGLRNFRVYKPRLRTMTSATTFWNSVKPYVRFWGQEAYADCHVSCVARRNGVPYSPPTRAQYVNSFLFHPARFSYAGGAASSGARTFYVSSDWGGRYFPLLTAYCCHPKYGNTDGLNPTQMKGLVSLQVYSVRRWAETHPYSKGRIGVAWNNAAPDVAALAQRTARAIQAAYQPGGTALDACREGADADYWCTRVVSGSRFNPCWGTFTRWSGDGPSNCRFIRP